MKKIIVLFAAIATLFAAQSCMQDEMYSGPATISNVEYLPGSVTTNDIVTVNATVSDLRGINSATLKYTINGGTATTVAMTAVGSVYSAQIPAQADGTTVAFVVEVVNALDLTAVSEEKSYTVSAFVVDYSGLLLNELNGHDKFIELYNAGATEIPMEGVYIQKDEEINWTCDARTLAPGEYLLLYSEDVVIAGEAQEGYPEALVFHSGLSAKKAVRVQLFTPAGASIMDFNLLTCVTPAPASYSYGPNDTKWYHADATPGTANAVSDVLVEGVDEVIILPDDELVILNELNGNDKFIEIYNSNAVEISIEGWYIEKDGSQNWIAGEGMTLAAGEYLLLYSEDVVVEGEAQEGYPEELVFHSGLSAKKAVKVELFMADGTSRMCFNLVTCALTAPASYSYGPNDTVWYHADATPGAANAVSDVIVEGLE